MKSPLQTFQGREDSVGASDPSLQDSPWEPGECHHGLTLEQGGFEVALGGPAGGRPQATLGGFSQARAPGRRPFPASGGIRAWFGLHAMEGAGCSPPHSDSPQFSGAKSLRSCLGPGSPDSVGGKGPSSGDGQCRVLGELPRPRPSPPVPDMSPPPPGGETLRLPLIRWIHGRRARPVPCERQALVMRQRPRPGPCRPRGAGGPDSERQRASVRTGVNVAPSSAGHRGE